MDPVFHNLLRAADIGPCICRACYDAKTGTHSMVSHSAGGNG